MVVIWGPGKQRCLSITAVVGWMAEDHLEQVGRHQARVEPGPLAFEGFAASGELDADADNRVERCTACPCKQIAHTSVTSI